MMTSARLFAAGLMLLLSVYDIKARSVEKSLKNDLWKREHYHIQADISLDKEDDEYNPVIDHTLTALPTGPSTSPSGSISTTFSSSSSTLRPFDWQPEYCAQFLQDAKQLPDIEESNNKTEFTPGAPFTEEEIQAALLNNTVPVIPIKLACRAVFPQNETKDRGVVNPNWPNAEIPYEIENTFTNDQRQMIIKAMEEIQNKTCISFPAWNHHSVWMRITLGGNNDGCYANSLGIPSSRPTVTIVLEYPGCFSQAIIVHEILHVAGIDHEQNRRDRDNYVTILWENVKEGDGFTRQFCKVKSIDTGHPYDYDSVMHYGEYDFSKDRGVLKTIDTKGNPVRQGNGMSQGDADQINYIYCNKTQDCETGWQQLDNTTKRYCFTAFPTSWYNAYAHCGNFGAGAQLAILDNESIRNDVKEHMTDNSISRAWVGANSRSDGFYWQNGNPVTNDSWSGTIPTPADQLCVLASRGTTAPKTLESLTCTSFYTTMYIICEK